MLFAVGGDLFLSEAVAGVTVYGFDADDILRAQTGDRAFNGGSAGGALADLAGQVTCEASVFGLSHQREGLGDFLIGEKV